MRAAEQLVVAQVPGRSQRGLGQHGLVQVTALQLQVHPGDPADQAGVALQRGADQRPGGRQ
jgi:hypothetical protein